MSKTRHSPWILDSGSAREGPCCIHGISVPEGLNREGGRDGQRLERGESCRLLESCRP